MTFRFTIRDLLWLMVVVGLACALLTSWQQTFTQRQKATSWRTRAGALEAVLKDAGWQVDWKPEWISVRPPEAIGANGHIAQIRTDVYEPSTD
jgi:hypothetical protein